MPCFQENRDEDQIHPPNPLSTRLEALMLCQTSPLVAERLRKRFVLKVIWTRACNGRLPQVIKIIMRNAAPSGKFPHVPFLRHNAETPATWPAILRLVLICALGLVVLTGCTRRYTVTLQNGNRITAHSKPKLEDGAYVFKDGKGETMKVPRTRVREIAPESQASSPYNSGESTGPLK